MKQPTDMQRLDRWVKAKAALDRMKQRDKDLSEKKIRHALLKRLIPRFYKTSVKQCVIDMNRDGFNYTQEQVLRALSKSDVQNAIIHKATGGGMSKEKLQYFWDKVMMAEEADGWETLHVREEVQPGDDDFDPDRPMPQYRFNAVSSPKMAAMRDRLRASELLAKSAGMFIEKVDVQHSFAITDLLDEDIKTGLPGSPDGPAYELPPLDDDLTDDGDDDLTDDGDDEEDGDSIYD